MPRVSGLCYFDFPRSLIPGYRKRSQGSGTLPRTLTCTIFKHWRSVSGIRLWRLIGPPEWTCNFRACIRTQGRGSLLTPRRDRFKFDFHLLYHDSCSRSMLSYNLLSVYLSHSSSPCFMFVGKGEDAQKCQWCDFARVSFVSCNHIPLNSLDVARSLIKKDGSFFAGTMSRASRRVDQSIRISDIIGQGSRYR